LSTAALAEVIDGSGLRRRMQSDPPKSKTRQGRCKGRATSL
jgi:hypothetical protein